MNDVDFVYRKIVQEMPDGLDRAIMLVLLTNHVGKDKSILGADLVKKVRQYYPQAGELHRKVRLAINAMRKKGYLICSAPGSSGGYWLAADQSEVVEFISTELVPKIEDMSVTKNIMYEAAMKQLGRVYQEKLLHV